MIPDMYNNPFIACTARDMEYSDILTYWCQPYDYFEGLDEYLKLLVDAKVDGIIVADVGIIYYIRKNLMEI